MLSNGNLQNPPLQAHCLRNSRKRNGAQFPTVFARWHFVDSMLPARNDVGRHKRR